MAILEDCPDVKDVTVEVSPRIEPGRPLTMVPARYKRNEVYGIQFTGTTPSYEWVYNANPEKGRFFSEAENLHHMDVAVIGHDLATGLFHDEDPLGKSIEVGGALYQVVGVLEKRKGQFFKDESADKVVVVPYAAYHKHNPQDDENFIGAQAYPGRKAQAEDEIIGLMRRRRGVAIDKPNNFAISSSEEMARQFRQITGAIAILAERADKFSIRVEDLDTVVKGVCDVNVAVPVDGYSFGKGKSSRVRLIVLPAGFADLA